MSLFEIVKQVIFSWQVIVAVVVIVLYISIVSYVARSYHRPRTFKKININVFKKKPSNATALPAEGPEEAHSSGDSNDDLGLEEA